MRYPAFLITLALLALHCLCPCCCFPGQDIEMFEAQGVKVYFAKSLEPSAREILSIYPEVKEELEEMLGWQLEYRSNVLLIKDQDKFEKMTGSNLFCCHGHTTEKTCYHRLLTDDPPLHPANNPEA